MIYFKNIRTGDVVRSSVVADCSGRHPRLTVLAVSKPGATGWVGLKPEEDVLVTVHDDLRGNIEIFIDTIISVEISESSIKRQHDG